MTTATIDLLDLDRFQRLEHHAMFERLRAEDPVSWHDYPGGQGFQGSVGDAFYAFGDTCTHRGCSLAEGELEATIVTCPCHGSQFDVTTGEVLRGPAVEPVRSYPARVESGVLRVDL